MKFAFVFPGQGSQAVGMLDAWGDHPVVLETLTEASDALVVAVVAEAAADDADPEASVAFWVATALLAAAAPA